MRFLPLLAVPASLLVLLLVQEAPDEERTTVEFLREQVEFFSELAPERSAGNPESLELAAARIRRELRAAGGRVADQPFEVEGVTYRNVLARFGPEEGPRLVVAAHYDCFEGTPGADDNASGVAVLLALAHALSGIELDATVELAAYTLEEPPHYDTADMGSVRHARSLELAGVELIGMVSLEMLGYFSDGPDSQEYPVAALGVLHGNVADFLGVVARPQDAEFLNNFVAALESGSELPFKSIVAPRTITGVDFSDHRSFWDCGYSALMLTDTAFFRNSRYHEPTDTAESLDYERMDQCLASVLRAVQDLTAAAPPIEGADE